ncbi:MAG: tetratricopeptide repeat protein [Bacillota bacterium]
MKTAKLRLTLFEKRLLILLLLLGMAMPVAAQPAGLSRLSSNPGPLLVQANQEYEKGNFRKAVADYRQLVERGYESGSLYFNLGNAYLKLGQKGWAVLYYEKAKRLIPWDRDLKTNLSLALSGVDEGETNWKTEWLQNLTGLAPLNQLTLASSFLFFLFTFFAILAVLKPAKILDRGTGGLKKAYRIALPFTGCLFLLVLLLTGLAYYPYCRKQAVVITTGATAFLEPGAKATASYSLSEGSRVEIMATKGGWLLVKRLDGKRGWARAKWLKEI